MTEETSKDVSAIAAKGLAHPDTLTPAEIQKVCASALTQAPDHIDLTGETVER